MAWWERYGAGGYSGLDWVEDGKAPGYRRAGVGGLRLFVVVVETVVAADSKTVALVIWVEVGAVMVVNAWESEVYRTAELRDAASLRAASTEEAAAAAAATMTGRSPSQGAQIPAEEGQLGRRADTPFPGGAV